MQKPDADESMMEVITNTQENQTLHTWTTGGMEYDLILNILMHSGANKFCPEVETAWLEGLEDKCKYIP